MTLDECKEAAQRLHAGLAAIDAALRAEMSDADVRVLKNDSVANMAAAKDVRDQINYIGQPLALIESIVAHFR